MHCWPADERGGATHALCTAHRIKNATPRASVQSLEDRMEQRSHKRL